VLLIDADPQGSLSQGFFGSHLIECLEPHETLAALFDQRALFATPATLPVSTPFDGISLVRANQALAPHNAPSPETAGLAQFVLHGLLEELTGFDVVLIDCPPNLYLCSWNAMLAADYVLIPVPPEDFGTQGLRAVHQAIDQARRLNPKLRRLGHLVTRYDGRLLVHRSYEQRLRTLYHDGVLETVIPEASAFKVSLACRQPVAFHSRNTRAARLTTRLCREILDRITARTAKLNVA